MNAHALSQGLSASRVITWLRTRRTDPQVVWMAAVLIGLITMMALQEPRFTSTLNLLNLTRNTSFLVIIAAGQMLVMIVGGYDLSVGAATALASVVSSTVMTALFSALPDQPGLSIGLGVVAGLLATTGIGVLNGICVAFLKMPPFMVTLATLSISAGLAYYITHGEPVYGMPTSFTEEFGRAIWFGIPVVALVALAIVLVLVVLQRRTVYGRHLYAIGGNPTAAAQSGIAVGAKIVTTFALCSTLAGIVGVLLTARLGSGQANIGSDLMLQSIGAAVLGGAALSGGVGRIERLILSCLLLTVLSNGMNLLRIDSKIQTIVLGILLILFVLLSQSKSARGKP